VEFRAGSGLYWRGALAVEGVDFGLGFDAFIFVGPDHFWGGDYHRYAFDRVRSREFFDHSQFHAGYRMEGGRLRAEGLGREHIAEVTRHEVVERKALDMRHEEERHNFTTRAAAHQELTRAPSPGERKTPAAAAAPAAANTPRTEPAPSRATPGAASPTNRTPASASPAPRGAPAPSRATPGANSTTNRPSTGR
jgi:hypothetical protein